MKTDVKQLLAMPIYGDAYHDMPLFTAAHKIIMSKNHSMDEKIVALKKMNNDAMGFDDQVTVQTVKNYIAEIEANL